MRRILMVLVLTTLAWNQLCLGQSGEGYDYEAILPDIDVGAISPPTFNYVESSPGQPYTVDWSNYFDPGALVLTGPINVCTNCEGASLPGSIDLNEMPLR